METETDQRPTRNRKGETHKLTGADLQGIRKFIFERSHDQGTTLADLSRAIGKNQAYMHQYMSKGTPKRLDEDSRAIIAAILGVAEDQLREPGARAPAATGLRTAHRNAVCRPINSDIPLFRESEVIDPACASNWVAAMVSGGQPVPFAVWVERPRKKLTPGDIVFAKPDHPVRPTDQVVVLVDNKVACLGEVQAVGALSITVECLSQQVEFMRSDVQVLKIVGVAYP